MQHHDDTVAAFAEASRRDPDAIGLVLVGSVARGTEGADSDVDVYLVVAEPAFHRARHSDRLSYTAPATYPGGYVDVKVISRDYLARAAEKADEPTRASFVGARVIWSQDPALDAVLARISNPGDEFFRRRATSFIAHMRLQGGYFLAQGEKREDPYLTAWASLHMIAAADRALLSTHRVLFRGHKYLREMVAALPGLPPDYERLVAAQLRRPTASRGRGIMRRIEDVREWDLPADATLSRYIEETELCWLFGTTPPEYC
ncbi:nucleotidyltransferase domain-containing protein [Microbacterium sp. 4R-513]|uniref:nucleotidyltransferase domain-containing protein n=1 Tax=Microbacterium sp. 4R-513 TaxID=2567934 RepID=UPI0013E1E0ED|nr:nucleotidyltransferase domain-containing protein [Microbacterium sp. 4R-513]QIG39487.1 nucleotidyltransferase domain-containing protein [Microbacterium sp. 4R-513]